MPKTGGWQLMKLEGKSIAICATRKANDIAERITKLGGMPSIEDIVGMTYLDKSEIVNSIKDAISKQPSYFIFTTGEGTHKIFDITKEINIYEQLINIISQGIAFARGYKTKNVLTKYGLDNLNYIENMEELQNIFKEKNLREKTVFIQMYGEDLIEFENTVINNGGDILKTWIYKYVPDFDKIDLLIKKLLNSFYDAILFTSAFQVKWLFERARQKGLKEGITNKMNEIILVAIGKTTENMLHKNDINNIILPQKERLVYAIEEMIRVFENG